MKKILLISDMNQKGSGYMNITTALATGLVDSGEYEVKVVGLDYKGEEHWNNFSIIPAPQVRDMFASVSNLRFLWPPDVIVYAMDIPQQGKFLNFCQQNKIGIPIIGIYPLESVPLSMSWASMLSVLDKSLIISEFGTEEAKKFGLNAEYIPIGIDRKKWKKPTEEERAEFRMSMGMEEDDFVILTVAENQERKNLSASMEIVKGVAESIDKNVKYILVTREHLEVGWALRDYWAELSKDNPKGELFIYERGMPQDELWMLYASSDAFLLTSKAEGAGMPIFEAMSVGLPVFGTDACAIAEHLSKITPIDETYTRIDRRGYPLAVEFVHRDTWQNAKRYYVDVEDAVNSFVMSIHDSGRDERLERAEEYISTKTWDKAVKVLIDAVEEVTSEISPEVL